MFLPRRMLIIAINAALLSACGLSSVGTSSGVVAVKGAGGGAGGTGGTGGGTSGVGGLGHGGEGGTIGTHDTVVATPPIAGVFSVVVGSKQMASVTFNSSDGRVMSGFGLTNNLGALPAGWSGPKSFGCDSFSTGSGCVLNLQYAPTAYETGGTITLNYLYVDNDLEPDAHGGSMTFAYQATTHNNVVAAVSPLGQINATVNSSSQVVDVGFTTDDAHPASSFVITTDAGTLPPGWSGPAMNSCATLSAGTDCRMSWTFTPTAPSAGTLTIGYSFMDDSGSPKSSTFNIPYAATARDNAVATMSPAGSIRLVAPASQAVTATFTTDDTFTASGLMITSDLSALPPGWSTGSPSFACAAFGTGGACQLGLTYAPQAADTGGTLQLTYGYFDNAGEAKTGSINISYSAASRDDAVTVVSPSATLHLASPASQAVSVNFTTSDAFPATGLAVDLSSLPANWSGAAPGFACASFGVGTSCTLTVTYSPQAADAGGTLSLPYTYTDDAGDAKSGAVHIVYSAD